MYEELKEIVEESNKCYFLKLDIFLIIKRCQAEEVKLQNEAITDDTSRIDIG